MSETVADAMTERAVDMLVGAPDGWRRVVRTLVAGWPHAGPLDIVFALVSAATTLETMRPPLPGAPGAAGQAMRLAALLGTDLYAMQALELPADTAFDLHGYWAEHDRYFLDL